MSYSQAKTNTDKWNGALIKKGAAIDEKPEDVEIIKEWKKEGFKIVKQMKKDKKIWHAFS